MLKIFVGSFLFLSFAFSAEKTLFFLPPYTKSWFNSTPVVVENSDRSSTRAMTADTLGWFRFSWDENALPDSVLVYSGRDSLFLKPVGFGGFPVSTVRQIPLKMLFDAAYPEQGSVFYVPEESQRPGEDVDFGFYARDIRLETGCFATSKAFTLYFLVPDYKDWIEETPVIVDAKEASVRWKMTADGENPGWFRFQWNDGEYRPEGLYIYRESDSLSTSPIGKNGYALGETDLIPFGLENADSLFLVPDLNYDCRGEGDALYGSPEIVHLRDIRKTCPLQKLSLSDDFSPGCHEGFKRPYSYSVYSDDSALVKEASPLTGLQGCISGTFLNGCLAKISIDKKICGLEPGRYFAKIRDEALDSSFAVHWTVETTPIPAKGFRNASFVRVENSLVRIHSASRERFAVFNSLGQIVFKGIVRGETLVAVPAAGNYLVKIGAETFRVQVGR